MVARFLKQVLLITVLGWNAVVEASTVGNTDKICADIMDRYRLSSSLPLRAGQELEYYIGGTQLAATRLDGLYIDAASVATDADIARVATQLGDVQVYGKRMRAHLKKHPGTDIPLDHVLSGLLSKYTGSQRIICGANCFDAALKWNSDKWFLRGKFLAHPEFLKVLDKDYQRVEPGSLVQIGDMFVVRLKYPLRTEAIHAGVYIGGDYIWHKPSSGRTPYTFERLSQLLMLHERANQDSLVPGHVEVDFYRTKSPSS